MARERRDIQAQIDQVKRNPNISGRQRQQWLQQLQREMTQSDQRAAQGGTAQTRSEALHEQTMQRQAQQEAANPEGPQADPTNPDAINKRIDRIWNQIGKGETISE